MVRLMRTRVHLCSLLVLAVGAIVQVKWPESRRWTACFEHPYSFEHCCQPGFSAPPDFSDCFDQIYIREECCNSGFTMAFADSSMEPLRFPLASSTGEPLLHAALSSVQAEWETEFMTSSVEMNVKLLGGVPTTFRFFKNSKYAVQSMLEEEVAKDVYGLRSLALRPGAWVVDVGAHLGGVAVAAARLHPGVRVVALEPDPTQYRYLLSNLRLNGVLESVIALNAGACPAGETASYTIKTPTNYLERPRGAPCVQLGELLGALGLERLALLKVDCEGCEFSWLGSADADVLRRVDMVIGEIHFPGPEVPHYQVTRAREVMCAPGREAHGCSDPAVPIPL